MCGMYITLSQITFLVSCLFLVSPSSVLMQTFMYRNNYRAFTNGKIHACIIWRLQLHTDSFETSHWHFVAF